jgi:hypothetical protein
VNNTRNSGGHEPRKSEKTVDHVAKTVQEKIPVVRFPVLQVVTGVVDQVPGDSVVKVKEDVRK